MRGAKFGKYLLSSIMAFFVFAGVKIATAAPKIVLKSITGAKISPTEMKGAKATVFFFVTHDCPISNGYAPEIERIYKAFSDKNFSFFLVYVDPAMTLETAKKHHKEYAYSCPALLDPKHQLVKRTGVSTTPETAVLSPEGKMLYRGRIDDRAEGFGKVRTHPNQRDLRLALDAILAGKPVAQIITKAVGCSISDLAK